MSQSRASLQDKLRQDLNAAVRSRDELRTSVFRLLLAAIHNAEIDRRRPLDDPDMLEVISQEAKRHRESIEGFRRANRQELVSREEAELAVLAEWLPAQLSREEVAELARQAIQEAGAAGPRDKGRVMGKLMPQVKGRAEGQVVSQVVDELLASLT